MCIKRLKLVTFDATNTLLKFRVPPWQYYAVTARDHGFKGSADDVKHRLLGSYKVMWDKHPNFGRSTINWEEWWRNVVRLTFEGQLPTSANVHTIASQLIDEFRTSKCWCLAEGAAELLQLLHKNGITLGVISNFDPRLYDILQSVELKNSFNFIITSYEAGYSKPDKRIFKHAIEQCNKGIKPEECLHIGDDVTKDYEGARAAGWHALLVKKIKRTEKPPAEDHVFDNLEDLSSVIKNEKLKL